MNPKKIVAHVNMKQMIGNLEQMNLEI